MSTGSIVWRIQENQYVSPGKCGIQISYMMLSSHMTHSGDPMCACPRRKCSFVQAHTISLGQPLDMGGQFCRHVRSVMPSVLCQFMMSTASVVMWCFRVFAAIKMTTYAYGCTLSITG